MYCDCYRYQQPGWVLDKDYRMGRKGKREEKKSYSTAPRAS